MIARERALLVVGSPKPKTSTSASLGGYLLDRLAEQGLETRTLSLAQRRPIDGWQRAFLAAVDAADLLILAFPLYAGSAPAIGIEALELILAHRLAVSEPRRQAFVALENHGLPEPEQAATALAICRRFAHEAGMEWGGALSLPMGPVLRERPPAAVGFAARNVTKSLDVAARALASGQAVPEAAIRLLAKPMVPRSLFALVAVRDFRKQARANGVLERCNERPYMSGT